MLYIGRENERMKYIEDIEAREKLNEFLKNYNERNINSTAIHIKGEGGVGKSTFLKKIAEAYRKEDVSVYIEVSACSNEIEILKLLVDQLHDRKETFGFEKFLFLYEWFYGSYSQKPKIGMNEEEKYLNIWSDKLKLIAGDWGKTLFELFREIIFTEKYSLPFSVAVNILSKILGTVTVLNEKDSALNYLCSIGEYVESERSRRKLLKDLFIEEYLKSISSDQQRMIIIIDNFCLQAGSNFERNLEWLSGEKGLFKNIPAAWIIGSRMTFDIGIQNQIILTGFIEKQAEQCLKEECKFTDFEKKNQLLKDMLKLALEKNGDKITYLPYKLNIIVNHYQEQKDKRNDAELTIDDFKVVDGELVSEYFYMDLPEYRVNAAQILSCMDTWNERRLDIVRKKFNDLLLNSRHLRTSNISIEEIGNGNFKLHESTKDALYKNDRNVIKYDVQEFIFKEFCDLFSNDNLKKSIARDYKVCNMYITLSVDYLKFISQNKDENEAGGDRKTNENHRQMLKKIYELEELADNDQNSVEKNFFMFFRCLQLIYEENCKPELIEEEFVGFYEKIIDDLKEVINSTEETYDSPLYIRHRKMLADLYTNISRPDRAEPIEKECLEQTVRLYNSEKEKPEVTSRLFLTESLLLNCRNAYAYDLSFEWQYENAYDEGWKGLCQAAEFICIMPGRPIEKHRTIIGSIFSIMKSYDKKEKQKQEKEKQEKILELKKAFRKALKLLNRVYIFSEKMDVAVDSKEFPNKEEPSILYEELVDAYRQLLSIGNWVESNSEGLELRKRVKVLIRVLFNNVNKLRGNFPWYCICENKEEPNRIIRFAIKTYLLRKAQHEALQDKEVDAIYKPYIKDMYAFSLQSYHNLGVYLFRLGRFDEAFEIGVEACFRRMQGLQLFDLTRLSDAQNIRYNYVVEGKITEHCISDIIGLLDISINEHLQANNNTLESIQYLGNYLLYKKKYKMAIDKLGEAYINRYIRYGIKQSKTLDCGLRLAVALYGSGEDKLAVDLLDDICKNAEDFLHMGITEKRLDEYKLVKGQVENKENIENILRTLL